MTKIVKAPAAKTGAKTSTKKTPVTKVKCQDASKGPISLDTLQKQKKNVVVAADGVDEKEQASAMQSTFRFICIFIFSIRLNRYRRHTKFVRLIYKISVCPIDCEYT